MKPSLAKLVLRKAFQANRPVFLKGAPGVGKSAIVHQIAQEYNLPVIEIRATLIDPVDLRGIPTVVTNPDGTKTTVWARPSFLPDYPCVLFFDEINAAPPLVQASLYQPMLLHTDGCRYIGEHKLHEDTRVVAAGNMEGQGAVVNEMPSPLRIGRLISIEIEADLEDFAQWGNETGKIRAEVLAFVRFRPGLLHKFDPDAEVSPAPRSYEVLSDMLATDLPSEVEQQVIAGIVGEPAAIDFTGFLRVYRQLPMPQECVANPTTARVPNDPAALYAIGAALAHHATRTNFQSIVKYMTRISEEYQVMFMRDAVNRTPELQETRAFIEWGARNSNIILAAR